MIKVIIPHMNLLRLFFPQKDPSRVKKEYNIPDQIDWEI